MSAFSSAVPDTCRAFLAGPPPPTSFVSRSDVVPLFVGAVVAALVGLALWRMWERNGTRGARREGPSASMLLGGVALFVVLVVLLVGG